MVRNRAIEGLAFDISRDVRTRPEYIMEAFVGWYYGYQVNKCMQQLDLPIVIKLKNGETFTVRDFSSDFTRNEVEQRCIMQRMQLAAVAYPDGAVTEDTPEELEVVLSNGDSLRIRLRPVCQPTEPVEEKPAEEGNDERRSAPKHQRSRGGYRIRDEISQQDLTMIELITNQASNVVIEHLKQNIVTPKGKKLDEYCYRLAVPQRIVAAVRVVSHNHIGEKGEDILVHELFSGNILPAFSADYGDAREWIESIRNNPYRHERFEVTPEEEVVLTAFAEFMKKILLETK